jgi:hypothetical protein
MSEKFDEQISQFIDDEMTAEECEFFVRRLQRDTEARACYRSYQLIGTVLRRDHEPLSRAIAGQLPAGGVASPDRQATGWRARSGLGIGLAASVAFMAVLVLAIFGIEQVSQQGLEAQVAMDTAPSGTGETLRLLPPEAEETGIQYLIHHTVYSSGLPRQIMRSGFVAAPAVDIGKESGADPLE